MLARRIPAAEAAHIQRVGDDDALKAHFALEQIANQLARERGGQVHAVFLFRLIGGQGDMARHDGIHTRIDDGLEHPAGRFSPLLHTERIIGGDDMLVAPVHAIAGEMLGAGSETMILHAANDAGQQAAGEIRIIREAPHVDQRIAGIDIQIAHRRKRPVRPDAARLKRGGFAVVIGELLVTRRAEAHHIGQDCEAAQHAAAAIFKIGRDQQGDFGIIRIAPKQPSAVFQADVAGLGDNFAEEKRRADLIGDKAVFGNLEHGRLLRLLVDGQGMKHMKTSVEPEKPLKNIDRGWLRFLNSLLRGRLPAWRFIGGRQKWINRMPKRHPLFEVRIWNRYGQSRRSGQPLSRSGRISKQTC